MGYQIAPAAKMNCPAMVMVQPVGPTSSSASRATALMPGENVTTAKTAPMGMMRKIVSQQYQHAVQMNFSVTIGPAYLHTSVVTVMLNAETLVMNLTVNAKIMNLNVLVEDALTRGGGATGVLTVKTFLMRLDVNVKRANSVAATESALTVGSGAMVQQIAGTIPTKTIVNASTQSFVVETEDALTFTENVMELLTVVTTRMKGIVLANQTSSAARMGHVLTKSCSVTILPIAEITQMNKTAMFQVALPHSSGVVMDVALTLEGNVMIGLTAMTSVMRLTVSQQPVQQMSSGANLESASGFPENVTAAQSAPTEVTRKIAAQPMNSIAKLESALQKSTGVTVSTTVEMDLTKLSAGHVSLGSMSVPMPSALSALSVVMAGSTALTSRTKLTALLMRASTLRFTQNARQ